MSESASRREGAYPWWTAPAAWLGAALLRTLGSTWRVERVGQAEHDARSSGGAHCIFALWHSRLLPLTYFHRDRGIAALISRHRDGELVTRVVERLGYETARGSSTRGGEEGLLEMIGWTERGRSLAFTPDGPRGPAERVKPGLAYLASRTGVPILPVAAAARSEWRLRSWDGFRVPKPFSRLVVAYGTAIQVPPGLDRDALESWRAEIERRIAAATRVADERAGNPA